MRAGFRGGTAGLEGFEVAAVVVVAAAEELAPASAVAFSFIHDLRFPVEKCMVGLDGGCSWECFFEVAKSVGYDLLGLVGRPDVISVTSRELRRPRRRQE